MERPRPNSGNLNPPPRISNRINKIPVTMNKDFLWLTGPPNSKLPTTSAVVKNDTIILATPKQTQISDKDTKQPLLNGNYFKIFHQNIRSLRDKHQELLSHLFPNLQSSSIHCSLFTVEILHSGKHSLSVSNCGLLGYDTEQSDGKLQEEHSTSIVRTHMMVAYSIRAR
jgi:hypothetical protein